MPKTPVKKRLSPENVEILPKRGRGRPPKDPNSTEKCKYTKKKRPEFVLQKFPSKRTTFTSILAEPLESELAGNERQKLVKEEKKPAEKVVDNVQQTHEVQNFEDIDGEEKSEKPIKPAVDVVDNVQQHSDSENSESGDDYIENRSKRVTFLENKHGHVVPVMWLFQKASEDDEDSEDVKDSEDAKDSEDVRESEDVRNLEAVKYADDVDSFQVTLRDEGVIDSDDTENVEDVDDSDDFEYFEKLFGTDDVKVQDVNNSEDVENSDDRNLEDVDMLKDVGAPEDVEVQIPEDLKDLEDVMIMKDFEFPEDVVKDSQDVELFDYVERIEGVAILENAEDVKHSENLKPSEDVGDIENIEKEEQMEILKYSEDVKFVEVVVEKSADVKKPEDAHDSDDVEVLEVRQTPEDVRRPSTFRIPFPMWYGDSLYQKTREEDKIVHKYTVRANSAPGAPKVAPNAPRAMSLAPSSTGASKIAPKAPKLLQCGPRALCLNPNAPRAPKPLSREIVYDPDSDIDVETDDEQKWTDNDIDKGWELKKEEPDDYQYPGIDYGADDVVFEAEYDGGGNLVQRE